MTVTEATAAAEMMPPQLLPMDRLMRVDRRQADRVGDGETSVIIRWPLAAAQENASRQNKVGGDELSGGEDGTEVGDG